MNSRISPLLAETPQGKAFYCRCRNRISLDFRGQRFVFDRPQIAKFREVLQRLLLDAPLVERLVAEAVQEACARGRDRAAIPGVGDLREMLSLIDDSLFILDAMAVLEAG